MSNSTDSHTVIAETNDTHFDVLFDSEHPLAAAVARFLDRFLGVWNLVPAPEHASHLILLPLPDSRFSPRDAEWAELLFQRKGSEANIYEFDRFENQLVALGMDTIRARRASRAST